MSTFPWGAIQAAVDLVRAENFNKVNGDGFKVYKVSDGTIRIDIPPIKEKK